MKRFHSRSLSSSTAPIWVDSYGNKIQLTDEDVEIYGGSGHEVKRGIIGGDLIVDGGAVGVAKNLHISGDVLIKSAGTQFDFEGCHIQGAVQLDVQNIDQVHNFYGGEIVGSGHSHKVRGTAGDTQEIGSQYWNQEPFNADVIGALSVHQGSGSQSISTTPVKVDQFDAANVEKIVTVDPANTKLVVPVGGYYRIDLWLAYESDASSGEEFTFTLKSTGGGLQAQTVMDHHQQLGRYNVTALVYESLSKGDELTLEVVADTGTSSFVLTDGEFGIQRVG